MSVKRYVLMFNATAASTSRWYEFDFRYDHAPFRTINVNLASGDTVTIEATTYDIKGQDINQLTVPADEIVTLKTYTSSGEDVIQGPWAAIRVVKEGTAGNAKVDGII